MALYPFSLGCISKISAEHQPSVAAPEKAVCTSAGLTAQGSSRMSHILDELKALHAASQEERARLAQMAAEASSLRAENDVLKQKCQSLVCLLKQLSTFPPAPKTATAPSAQW